MVLRSGQIYRGFIAEANKVKRFVILSISQDKSEAYFLLINSQLTPFAANNVRYKSLNLPLAKEGRPYLDHDSFLCCENVHVRNRSELTNAVRWFDYLGMMSVEDLSQAKNIIKNLPIYSPYELEDFGIYDEDL